MSRQAAREARARQVDDIIGSMTGLPAANLSNSAVGAGEADQGPGEAADSSHGEALQEDAAVHRVAVECLGKSHTLQRACAAFPRSNARKLKVLEESIKLVGGLSSTEVRQVVRAAIASFPVTTAGSDTEEPAAPAKLAARVGLVEALEHMAAIGRDRSHRLYTEFSSLSRDLQLARAAGRGAMEDCPNGEVVEQVLPAAVEGSTGSRTGVVERYRPILTEVVHGLRPKLQSPAILARETPGHGRAE